MCIGDQELFIVVYPLDTLSRKFSEFLPTWSHFSEQSGIISLNSINTHTVCLLLSLQYEAGNTEVVLL